MRSRLFSIVAPVLLATTWAAVFWGCSASTGGSDFDDKTGSGNSTMGSGGASGQGGSTGTGINITSGSGGAGGGTLDPDASCAGASTEASFVPLDILILLDRSGSMSGTKWDGSTKALKDYVQSPDANGVNVGITYFPIDNPPDFEDCNYQHYDDIVVPIAELPANAPALVSSIDGEDALGGSTPMYGALKGALFSATAHQDANPTHKVIVVFASDGDPNSCSFAPGNPPNADDIPTIAALAESALNYNGVRTYVIAIQGATVANLNQIALAGGTNQAIDVTQNINNFLTAMKDIQSDALSCDIVIPEPPMGKEFDKDLVAVTYSPQGDPMQAVQIPRADNYQDCGGMPGWYYDNNVKPTKIKLCPASCQTIQLDKKAKLDVAFGCAPIVN